MPKSQEKETGRVLQRKKKLLIRKRNKKRLRRHPQKMKKIMKAECFAMNFPPILNPEQIGYSV